jgi:hypothetical protein
MTENCNQKKTEGVSIDSYKGFALLRLATSMASWNQAAKSSNAISPKRHILTIRFPAAMQVSRTPYNMGVNAEAMLFNPDVQPLPKTLMLYFKRMREIDVCLSILKGLNKRQIWKRRVGLRGTAAIIRITLPEGGRSGAQCFRAKDMPPGAVN